MQQSDINNIKNLGRVVKILREGKCPSLNKFVMEKGFLTTATWSRIENGRYDLKFSTLLKVAYMLEIDVIDLLKLVNFDYNFIDE